MYQSLSGSDCTSIQKGKLYSLFVFPSNLDISSGVPQALPNAIVSGFSKKRLIAARISEAHLCMSSSLPLTRNGFHRSSLSGGYFRTHLIPDSEEIVHYSGLLHPASYYRQKLEIHLPPLKLIGMHGSSLCTRLVNKTKGDVIHFRYPCVCYRGCALTRLLTETDSLPVTVRLYARVAALYADRRYYTSLRKHD